MIFRMGNGWGVMFWTDMWCGYKPLGEAFPTLFSTASTKDAWVVEMWKQGWVLEPRWKPFLRNFRHS